jgi:predicted RNase H-like nuclease (RuvC/YqgF family)
MGIHYDFIAYSSRTSETSWTIGMKAIQGEVPLDIVVPDEQTAADPDNPQVVGVLTVDGLERESSDGLELYRYLRRLNPKKNEAFSYNEVVIRNIHSRLSTLRINQELRVQITYTERKDPYTQFSYQIKLLGVIGNSDGDASEKKDSDITAPNSEDKRQDLQEQKSGAPPNQPVYRTTSTLEKLITFTQNLQRELDQTQKQLSVVVNKAQQLEDDRQQFRDIHNLIEDILDRLSRLETLDSRLQYLETDRHQLQGLQQTLRKFLVALNQQTRTSLQEHDDVTIDG